uniref:Uncharacterized protein n=1 Tax=Bionectria ochroleuca TaxID=29856 RepID=A0A8H7K4M2_BIOOC
MADQSVILPVWSCVGEVRAWAGLVSSRVGSEAFSNIPLPMTSIIPLPKASLLRRH